jgi:hypothetical protein
MNAVLVTPTFPEQAAPAMTPEKEPAQVSRRLQRAEFADPADPADLLILH